MSMPLFPPADDPGPSFANLLRRVGHDPLPQPGVVMPVTHATTCVAVRYAEGVVMAGDRRATSGNLISHRTMEKVFAADRFSGVAVAGAAGPAMEMVKLFQLQLEHYEKVEGDSLSLDGKANQLSQMIRSNLPAAMQGLVVVPIFAGFDTRRGNGRLFSYDVTGGRYEERDHTRRARAASTPAPSSRWATARGCIETTPSTFASVRSSKPRTRTRPLVVRTSCATCSPSWQPSPRTASSD